MPENSNDSLYIVYTRDKQVKATRQNSYFWNRYCECGCHGEDTMYVTHWMPMPVPPKK